MESIPNKQQKRQRQAIETKSEHCLNQLKQISRV